MAGIIRAPRPAKNYTEIANSTARDSRLSYRARGVLLRLLSNADGYKMTAIDLAKEGQEGREAVLTALKELRVCGYLVVRRSQRENGQWKTESYVYDTPISTEVGFPDSGWPDSGWPDPIQNNQQNNQEAAAPRVSAESVAARRSAAAAPIDSVRNPMPPASGEGKRRRVRPSGLVTWTPDDEAEAERLEAKQTAEVAEAVFNLRSAGKQPVPGLVSREIERIVAQRAAEERRQLAEAERQARLAAGPPPNPEAEARGRAFIASIAQKRRLALQGGG